MRSIRPKNKNFQILVIPILLLAFGFSAFSQTTENKVNHQFWTDLNFKYTLKPGLFLHAPVGYRTISPHKWDRFYINPQVRYDWPRLILKNLKYKEQIIGGVGVYFTNNQNKTDKLEIRPFQGYSLSAPNGKYFILKHFIQLEERFEINTSDWQNTFGLRFRYKASATIRMHGDFWEYANGFYIPVSIEFFWNLIETNQFNDKVRLNFGIGKSFNQNWKLAFFLGYNYSKESAELDFNSSDVIYRLRAYYTIPNKE